MKAQGLSEKIWFAFIGENRCFLYLLLCLTFVMFTLQGCEHSQKVNIPDNTIIYKNQTFYNQTVEDFMKLGKGSYYLRNKAVLSKCSQ